MRSTSAYRTAAVAMALVCGAGGCASAPKSSPPPRGKNAPWAEAVQCASLSAHNGYQLSGAMVAPALFPGALMVARLDAGSGEPQADTETAVLSMSPLGELVYWGQTFDDLWVISQVYPATFPRCRTSLVTREVLRRHAADTGAKLMLCYQIVQRDAATAEARGTLIDARDGSVLAAIHAEDRSDIPVDAPPEQYPPPPDRHLEDRRHVDPWFRVQDRFRGHVKSCVEELIRTNQPVYLHPAADGRRVAVSTRRSDSATTVDGPPTP